MDTVKVCAGCGAKVALDAPQGLCPQCLLKAGLETRFSTESGINPNGFVPPTPAELPNDAVVKMRVGLASRTASEK